MQNPLTFSFSSWVESMLWYPIGFMWFLPDVVHDIRILFAFKENGYMLTYIYYKWG